MHIAHVMTKGLQKNTELNNKRKRQKCSSKEEIALQGNNGLYFKRLQTLSGMDQAKLITVAQKLKLV